MREQQLAKSADRLIVFEDKQIRRVFHAGEWYFSIIDIVGVLTASSRRVRIQGGIGRILRFNLLHGKKE